MPRTQKKALAGSFQIAVKRALLRGLGRVHPKRAGRSATDLFLSSRRGRARVSSAPPLGARPLRVDQAGVDAAFVWGAGERTALLVHGWGSDSSSMYSLAAPLQRLGLRVVAYDAPAHGVSPGNRTTMRAFVSAVKAVATMVAPEIVIGHSLGAIASVAAIAESPAWSVKALVLVSAPCALNQTLHAFAGFWRLRPDVVEQVRSELLTRNGVPIEYWDIASLSKRVEAPVLIVHDRHDSFVPVDEAAKVAGAFRRADREITAGLGHARILADPGVAERIRGFLAGVAGA